MLLPSRWASPEVPSTVGCTNTMFSKPDDKGKMDENDQDFYFRKILRYALLHGLPGVLFTIIFLWIGKYELLVWISVLFILFFTWGISLLLLLETTVRPWQVISNIIGGFRENDYSLRGSMANPNDPIGLAHFEINQLADLLQTQRQSHIEQHKLLQKILHEIDVAIYCFDENRKLVMANNCGAKIFGQASDYLLGQTIDNLGLSFALLAAHETTHDHEFPMRNSRWLVKHGAYREGGKPHHMILLADIKETLREEELAAWQRLIRVLGHELNNSMTPLKTMAVGMNRIIQKDPLPSDWKDDLKEGFDVITDRVDNLSRFVSSYSQIAQQPKPNPKPFNLRNLLLRLRSNDPRLSIRIQTDKDCQIEADEAQLEQVFINVFKNAIDASIETQGEVSVYWKNPSKNEVEIIVEDEGQGVVNPDNLFVPYFTTKENGNGIGLFICRQIIEAHAGSFSLTNRVAQSGCIALIKLPIQFQVYDG